MVSSLFVVSTVYIGNKHTHFKIPFQSSTAIANKSDSCSQRKRIGLEQVTHSRDTKYTAVPY
jgi:hypothetical protein